MPDLLDNLNEPQRQAVCHLDGPMLVLAGAGSGKTRVITRRVAYLITQGVAPWNILAITFTNKAAGEMRDRVQALQAPPGATLCTFHALCAKLLREFALEANISANYSIYDREDQLRLLRQAVQGLQRRPEVFPPARVHAAISRAKNELKSPDDLLRQADQAATDGQAFYRRTVAELYAEYQRMLGENNALDFDDLLLRMAYLLRDRPDIRELLGRRYRYVLIDEYQDTNRAQYILAHGIAVDHHNLCVTGDPDQSIYAWRGADIRNIMEFEADYPDATVIRLEENYRSTRPILAAASSLIAHNATRKAKSLWTRREGGGDVCVVCCDDEAAEAGEVARRIARRNRLEPAYDEVAVFYRVNALSRVLERAFQKAGLPYRIARGVEFYNRKEVKDVLAYLRLLANPADDLSCARIINTPTRGIGAVTLKRLVAAGQAHGRSLLEACQHGAQADLKGASLKKTEAFAALIASLAGNLDRPVKAVVESVLSRSGLENALQDAGEDARQARANVAELVSNAAEFDQENPDARLADFLHQVSLVSDLDHFDGQSGAVTFMTLHAAKGLEFPAVFIVGCEDGLLPMARFDASRGGRRGPVDDLEEERRLAFVGMTRAKEELTLTCARTRMTRGLRTPQAVSPFLDEIGTDSVRIEESATPGEALAPVGPTRRPGRSRGGFYAEAAEREAIEAAMDTDSLVDVESLPDDVDPPPPEYEHLVVNCRIRHPKFGEGKVVALRHRWPKTRAEILFDKAGSKTIYLQYTHLEILDVWP